MNKNKKIIIAIVAAVVLVCAIVLAVVMQSKKGDDKPGELITVTEAVTNEQGEAVTNAQGEVVTEAVEAEVVTEAGGEVVTEVVTNPSNQPYTQKNGSNVTRAVTRKPSNKTTTAKKTKKKTTKKSESTTAKGDEKTTDKNNSTKPTEVATQAKKPGKITGLKVTDVKKDSITVTWDKLDCDKYQIRFGAGKELGDPQNINSTACTLDKLTSYTEYTIQVRGLNNSPGSDKGIAGEWTTIKQRTEPNNESRKIKINYTLPVGSKTGQIKVYVMKDGEKEYKLDSTADVKDDRTGETKTKKEYKGLVKVKIEYNDRFIISDLTDKDEITLEITDVNIGIANGDDD